MFNLLAYLIQYRDRVVSKEEFLERLWPGRIVGEATLTSRVKAVRQVIGDRGREQPLIQTLHGRGYRFIALVEEHPDDAPAGREPPHASRPPVLTQQQARALEAGRALHRSSSGRGRSPQEVGFGASQDAALPLTFIPPATTRAVGREVELS